MYKFADAANRSTLDSWQHRRHSSGKGSEMQWQMLEQNMTFYQAISLFVVLVLCLAILSPKTNLNEPENSRMQ